MSPATGPISRREIVGVLIAFALLCAWPFRDALFTTERAVFGVDCATVQLPWSTEIAAAAAEGGLRRIVTVPLDGRLRYDYDGPEDRLGTATPVREDG